MQYVKRVCGKIVASYAENSCVLWGNKKFGNLLSVNFVHKKIDSPREYYTSFLLVTRNVATYWKKLRNLI